MTDDTLPLPDDALPPPSALDRVLRGPKTDSAGRIVGGPLHGMTVGEVLAARDSYDRAAGDWLLGLLRGE